MKLTFFTDDFMKDCNNNKYQSHIIPIEVENNMKIMSVEQGLYAKVVMLCRKNLKITGANKNKMKINSSSRVSLKDHSVGLILVFIGLKKILSHVNLVSIGKSFKCMTKHNI